MTSRRSVFAKPLIHQPPGAYQPLRLLLIRGIRAILNLFGRPWLQDGAALSAFARRLEMAELWRTDILAHRVERARQMGMKVGQGCRLYSLQVASEAELVELGNNVIVSGDVLFATHDGAVFTALSEFPHVNGHYGRIRIGDGCFIGIRAVIMPGVELGDHCIVAAGAIVMDSFPANSVIAGNPATYLCPTPMYLELKRHSPATIYDPAYPFPLKFPPQELAARLASVPFKPVRRRDDKIGVSPLARRLRTAGVARPGA